MKTKIPQETFIPEGWKIESHEAMKSIDFSNLSLHFEPEQEKSYIKGEILRERMKGKGLNANVLDYLLAHQELIPEDWKRKYIYFWGTIYRGSDGGLCVRYLCWRDGTWGWSGYWLGIDWRSDDPAAMLASTSSSNPKTSSDTLSFETRVKALEAWKEKVTKALQS